jgi:hypothetical protein
MEMRILILLVCIWFSSCHRSDDEVGKEVSKEAEFILSRPFSGLYLEAKAVLKVRDYLVSKGMDIDSLYVYEIGYSDSCDISDDSKFSSDPVDACVAVFNIEHKVNHDYYLKIDRENARILEAQEKKNGDYSEPLLIPSKPDFLRKGILLYYYFEGDSIVDILSQ